MPLAVCDVGAVLPSPPPTLLLRCTQSMPTGLAPAGEIGVLLADSKSPLCRRASAAVNMLTGGNIGTYGSLGTEGVRQCLSCGFKNVSGTYMVGSGTNLSV